MRIGSNLVLTAVDAILKFAVTTSVSGVNLTVVGVVLMVVGIAGLVLAHHGQHRPAHRGCASKRACGLCGATAG
jgi:Co/Zn/Cd efflux system component